MRFTQLDRIVSMDPGSSLEAFKCLPLSEGYLKDHFPRFPVMPGVIMAEGLFQASMWLVRATDDFRYSMVVMQELKSVKFQGFMQPGDRMVITAELKGQNGSTRSLRVRGEIDGKVAASGRMVVDSFNLAERKGLAKEIDDFMRSEFRREFDRLHNPLKTTTMSGV